MDEKQDWVEIKQEDVWNTNNLNKINFIWKPCNFNQRMYALIDQAHDRQFLHHLNNNKNPKYEISINHLENHREITTKTGLIRSLKYYYKDNANFIENNYTVFDTTPTSFVVNSRLETD